MSATGLEPTRRERTQRSRRLAILLALVAAGFYVGFIALSLFAGRH
jgi:uncharacterized membrane protein (DUF485 family)